jgi:hypothetical protein
MTSTSFAGLFWTGTGAPGGSSPGNSLDFGGGNGADTFVSVPGLNINAVGNSGAYSMSAWISSGGTDGYYLGSTDAGVHHSLRGGQKLSFAHWGNDFSATTVVPNGPATDAASWVHSTYTYDGTTANIYLNGVLDGTAAVGGPNNSNGNFIIGARNNGDGGFNGQIDDVAVWDVVLSQAQITALAGGASPNAQGSPLGFWNFDEGTGLAAADSSGNGLDGSFLPPPVPLFLPDNPLVGNPLIINNAILFEMRTKAGGDQGQTEIYRLDRSDLNNDGIPDDPNVLVQNGMHVFNTNNVDAGNVYGLGWTSGDPVNPTMVNIDGSCCANVGQQDNLIMVNEFQLYDEDGMFEFTENFDDGVHISINGTLIHSDRGWNVRTNAVWNDDDGQGGGWYDVVIHGLEDGGGAADAGGGAFAFSNTLGGPFAPLIDGFVGDNVNGVSYRVVLDQQIPEPAALTLALIGMLGLCGLRRRRARG